MKKGRRKLIGAVLSLLFSVVMLAGGTFFFGAQDAHAATVTGDDAYYAAFFTADGNVAYCFNKHKNYPDPNGNIPYRDPVTDQATFAQFIGTVTPSGSTPVGYALVDNWYGKLQAALYYGYPNDADNIKARIQTQFPGADPDLLFRWATQQTIWRITDADGGNPIAVTGEPGHNIDQGQTETVVGWIEEKFQTGSVPDSFKMLLHLPAGGYENTYQAVLTSTVETPAPAVLNTTVTAGYNGSNYPATSAQPAKVVLEAGSSSGQVSLSDVVEYSGLDVSKAYTVQCDLIETSGQGAMISSAQVEVGGSDEGNVTVSFPAITMSSGKTYSIRTTITERDSAESVATHNAALDVPSETVIVEEGTPEEPDEYTIKISKRALGGNEIEGAQMKLAGPDGFSEEWTSGTSAKEFTVAPGEYELTEEVAPDGYQKVTTTIKFTVDEEGAVTLMTTEVEPGGRLSIEPDARNHIVLEDAPEETPAEPEGPEQFEVEISKVEVNGTEELPGAELSITSELEGFETITWTSGNETKKVTLAPGTYTLTEKTAPNGYEKAESITFVVDETGKVTINGSEVEKVRMEDAKTPEVPTYPVRISKKVLGGAEVAGAEMTLADSQGEVIRSWTSAAEAEEFTLSAGEYVLTEKTAPAGLTRVTTEMRFTLKSDGTVELITTEVDGGGRISVQDGSGIVLEDAPADEGGDKPADDGDYQPADDEDDESVDDEGDESVVDGEGNTRTSNRSEGTKTGDDAPIALAVMALLTSGLGLEWIRRRKMN